MPEQKNTCKLELMDIQIGITILLCLVLCHVANSIGIRIEALAVSTGAIMCVQDSTKSAYTTSLIRILGVVLGGLFGVVIVLIDNVIGIPYVFYLLCAVGVVANLLLCKLFKMIYVQARVSCLSLLLVVMVLEGVDRLDYAMSRFIGSIAGAVIALVVSMVFSFVIRKINRKNPGDREHP